MAATQHIKSDEGMINLAAAIIKSARDEYAQRGYEPPKPNKWGRGDIRERTNPSRFLDSEWFQTLTLGKVERDDVKKEWDEMHQIYDILSRVKLYSLPTEKDARDVAAFFKKKLRKENITLDDYVDFMIKNFNFHDGKRYFDKDREVLKKYGWYQSNVSEVYNNTFRATKRTVSMEDKDTGERFTKEEWYVAIKEPLYLRHTLPVKEVTWDE